MHSQSSCSASISIVAEQSHRQGCIRVRLSFHGAVGVYDLLRMHGLQQEVKVGCMFV